MSRFTYGQDRGFDRCVFRRKPGGWLCMVMFFEEVVGEAFGDTKEHAKEEARKISLTAKQRVVLSGHGSSSVANLDRDTHAANGFNGYYPRSQRSVCRSG
jgi:hypothetical protein